MCHHLCTYKKPVYFPYATKICHCEMVKVSLTVWKLKICGYSSDDNSTNMNDINKIPFVQQGGSQSPNSCVTCNNVRF